MGTVTEPTPTFDRKWVADRIAASRKAGYSDKKIFDYLNKQPQYKDKIDQSLKAGYKPDAIIDYLGEDNQQTGKLEEPLSLSGSAKALGSGYAGGFGGGVPDIVGATDVLSPFSQTASAANQLLKATGFKGSEELAEQIGGEPQNAVERILRQTGEFAGMEGLVGTAIGGPVGGIAGSGHGAVSGMLYGGLKELGVPDLVALGITAAATVSPMAARKFIGKSNLSKAAKKEAKRLVKFEKTLGEMEGLANREMAMETLTPEFQAQLKKQKAAKAKDLSQFDAAEEAVNELKKPIVTLEAENVALKKQITDLEKPVKAPGKRLGTEVRLQSNNATKPLIGRMTGGIKQSPGVKGISEQIERKPFKNTEQASNELRSEALAIKKPIQEKFDKDYTLMKKYTASIPVEETRILDEAVKLVDQFPETKLSNLQAGSKTFVTATREMLRKVNESASMNLSDLIEFQRIIGSIPKWQMDKGVVQGAYKQLYGLLKEQVAEILGKKNPGLLNRYNELNKKYGEFKDTFGNKNLSELLNKKDKNFESIYKSMLGTDSYNSLKGVLDKSKRGRELLKKVQRDIFDKSTSRKMTRTEINDLKKIVGKNKERLVDKFLALKDKPAYKTRTPDKTQAKIDKQTVPKVTTPKAAKSQSSTLEKFKDSNKAKAEANQKKIKETETTVKRNVDQVAKLQGMEPEQVTAMLNTRSGIRKLKKSLEGSPETFERLIKAKAKSILSQKKIDPKSTGTDLFNAMNSEGSYEIFREMLGDEPAAELLDTFEIMASDQATNDNFRKYLKKSGRHAARYMGAFKVLKLLFVLL